MAGEFVRQGWRNVLFWYTCRQIPEASGGAAGHDCLGRLREPVMDSSKAMIQQIDRILARVEALQQAVAQVYIELLALKKEVTPDGQASGEAVPMALPVSGLTPAPRPMDRRASPRRPVNQVLIGISSALDDSQPFSGWVLDYSRGGLGVFVDKRIAVGTFLHIRPSNAPPGSANSKEMEVKNCQRYLDVWRLGCKLEDELTPEDLKRFGLE